MPSESLSPQPVEFCNQIPLTFTVRFPGGSQSPCWIPALGYLLSGPDPLHHFENFSSIIVLQFASCPPGGSMAGLMVTSSKRTLGDGDRQGGLACCSPRGCKESNVAEWLNNSSRTEFPCRGGSWSKLAWSSFTERGEEEQVTENGAPTQTRVGCWVFFKWRSVVRET